MKNYHIMFKTLRKKDPKQFCNWLRKWQFNKRYVIDLLTDCDEFDLKDKSLTLLKLCKKYRDLIEELIEDELASM